MALNRLSVLVSIKTLCSEVDDYWQPIPADVMTIDGLKRQILTNECIVKDMDDVDLYLSGGLLLGHSSIGDVLRDRDHIELRVKDMNKKRINFSADSTSGQKKCKCSVNECLTAVASDDGSLSGGSGVQTIVKTENTSGNQLNDFTRDTKIMANLKSADKSLISETNVSDKVVIKSETIGSTAVATQVAKPDAWQPLDGHRVAELMIFECRSPGCDYKTNNPEHFHLHRSHIHHQFMCQFCDRQPYRTTFKLEQHHRRAHPYELPDIPWIKCTHEGCVYKTKDNLLLRYHINKRH